jgi:glycerol-3-phosphate cytidylyltransferase
MKKYDVGFTCSAFDLLHVGHIMMLEECKANCGVLCVGLQTDPTIDRSEKNKPVQSYFERYKQLKAIKYVDEVHPYETEADLLVLLKEISPQVRFVGEDYKDKPFTGKDMKNVDVYYNKRYGYSTTDLRERIANQWYTIENEKYT